MLVYHAIVCVCPGHTWFYRSQQTEYFDLNSSICHCCSLLPSPNKVLSFCLLVAMKLIPLFWWLAVAPRSLLPLKQLTCRYYYYLNRISNLDSWIIIIIEHQWSNRCCIVATISVDKCFSFSFVMLFLFLFLKLVRTNAWTGGISNSNVCCPSHRIDLWALQTYKFDASKA